METKSSGSSFSALADQLARISSRLFKESDPTRKLLFGQMNEALKTGGIRARIPIIQRAITQMKTANSQALAASKANLARMNLGSDPVSQGFLTSLGMSGRQAESQLPTEMAMQFITQAPGFANQTTGMGISGLGTAAGINRSFSGSQLQYSFDPFQYINEAKDAFNLTGGGAGRSAGGTASNQ